MKLTVTVHGLTRCRETVEILHKCRCGLGYQDALDLYNTWAKSEEDNEFGGLSDLPERERERENQQ